MGSTVTNCLFIITAEVTWILASSVISFDKSMYSHRQIFSNNLLGVEGSHLILSPRVTVWTRTLWKILVIVTKDSTMAEFVTELDSEVIVEVFLTILQAWQHTVIYCKVTSCTTPARRLESVSFLFVNMNILTLYILSCCTLNTSHCSCMLCKTYSVGHDPDLSTALRRGWSCCMPP